MLVMRKKNIFFFFLIQFSARKNTNTNNKWNKIMSWRETHLQGCTFAFCVMIFNKLYVRISKNYKKNRRNHIFFCKLYALWRTFTIHSHENIIQSYEQFTLSPLRMIQAEIVYLYLRLRHSIRHWFLLFSLCILILFSFARSAMS